jgi:hypothetical protein
MDTLEAALGTIVFGPNAETLEGVQWTAAKLRQAATLLEYRYAIERRYAEQHNTAQLGEQTGDPTPAMQQAPAKRRRNRGRPAKGSNGSAATPPPADPLFVEIPATP